MCTDSKPKCTTDDLECQCDCNCNEKLNKSSQVIEPHDWRVMCNRMANQ